MKFLPFPRPNSKKNNSNWTSRFAASEFTVARQNAPCLCFLDRFWEKEETTRSRQVLQQHHNHHQQQEQQQQQQQQ